MTNSDFLKIQCQREYVFDVHQQLFAIQHRFFLDDVIAFSLFQTRSGLSVPRTELGKACFQFLDERFKQYLIQMIRNKESKGEFRTDNKEVVPYLNSEGHQNVIAKGELDCYGLIKLFDITLLEKTPERVIATFQKKNINPFGFEQLPDNQIISAYESKKIVNRYLIQEIEQKIDMKQIAEQYVILRKTGRSYCGYSPFRSERTASFHVFPETNTWYDFGLSEGGNAISFIRKQHDFSFSQAVACLYKWSKQQPYQRTLRIKEEEIVRKYTKDELRAVLEFYQKVTEVDSSKLPEPVKLYLDKRRIASETAKVFNLSYVDQEVNTQIHRNDGAIIEQLAESGVLFRKSDGRIAFKMENRLAVPLHDEFGAVIGYNGRAYDEQREPKYLLTNTTPLFQKSAILFNYHRAKQEVEERGNLIVTEGVFDVMRCHQQGFPQAVALLGSSVSTKQLELIKQLAVPVLLALDHDSAGEKAAQRIGEQLAQAQIKYEVFPLPIGQDLDQALQQFEVQQELLNATTRIKSELKQQYEYMR